MEPITEIEYTILHFSINLACRSSRNFWNRDRLITGEVIFTKSEGNVTMTLGHFENVDSGMLNARVYVPTSIIM